MNHPASWQELAIGTAKLCRNQPLERITVMSKHFQRCHGRACPGHPRLAALKKGVDARDKRGHDAGRDSIRPETTLIHAPAHERIHLPWPQTRCRAGVGATRHAIGECLAGRGRHQDRPSAGGVNSAGRSLRRQRWGRRDAPRRKVRLSRRRRRRLDAGHGGIGRRR
jgi:hypothetical protein